MSSEVITKNDLLAIFEQIGYSSHKLYAITISTSDWDNNEATITAPGVTTSNVIFIAPAPNSAVTYIDSKIICSEQTTNSLTFSCKTIPSSDVVANVMIM